MNLFAINARCCTFFENTIRGSLNHLDRRIASFVFVIFSCLASIGLYYKYIYKPRKIAEEELSKDIPYEKKLMLAKQAGKYASLLCFHNAQLNEKDLKDLFKYCPNIERLYLDKCKIDKTGMAKLPKKLKELTLEDVEIEDEAMWQLPEKLTFLNITNTNKTSLSDKAFQKLPPLNFLHVFNYNTDNLTNNAFQNLPDSLRTFGISSLSITQNGLLNLPKNLTSLSINLIKLSNLNFLSRNLKNLTLAGNIINIENLKDLPQDLETLSFIGNVRLQNEGLDYLPENLIKLFFNTCTITNEGIAKLKRLKKLRKLFIENCKQINDSIADHLPPHLERLILFDCRNVTPLIKDKISKPTKVIFNNSLKKIPCD